MLCGRQTLTCEECPVFEELSMHVLPFFLVHFFILLQFSILMGLNDRFSRWTAHLKIQNLDQSFSRWVLDDVPGWYPSVVKSWHLAVRLGGFGPFGPDVQAVRVGRPEKVRSVIEDMTLEVGIGIGASDTAGYAWHPAWLSAGLPCVLHSMVRTFKSGETGNTLLRSIYKKVTA